MVDPSNIGTAYVRQGTNRRSSRASLASSLYLPSSEDAPPPIPTQGSSTAIHAEKQPSSLSLKSLASLQSDRRSIDALSLGEGGVVPKLSSSTSIPGMHSESAGLFPTRASMLVSDKVAATLAALAVVRTGEGIAPAHVSADPTSVAPQVLAKGETDEDKKSLNSGSNDDVGAAAAPSTPTAAPSTHSMPHDTVVACTPSNTRRRVLMDLLSPAGSVMRIPKGRRSELPAACLPQPVLGAAQPLRLSRLRRSHSLEAIQSDVPGIAVNLPPPSIVYALDSAAIDVDDIHISDNDDTGGCVEIDLDGELSTKLAVTAARQLSLKQRKEAGGAPSASSQCAHSTGVPVSPPPCSLRLDNIETTFKAVLHNGWVVSSTDKSVVSEEEKNQSPREPGIDHDGPLSSRATTNTPSSRASTSRPEQVCLTTEPVCEGRGRANTVTGSEGLARSRLGTSVSGPPSSQEYLRGRVGSLSINSKHDDGEDLGGRTGGEKIQVPRRSKRRSLGFGFRRSLGSSDDGSASARNSVEGMAIAAQTTEAVGPNTDAPASVVRAPRPRSMLALLRSLPRVFARRSASADEMQPRTPTTAPSPLTRRAEALISSAATPFVNCGDGVADAAGDAQGDGTPTPLAAQESSAMVSIMHTPLIPSPVIRDIDSRLRTSMVSNIPPPPLYPSAAYDKNTLGVLSQAPDPTDEIFL